MLRDAFMDAIGSPMRFTNATIDQPGKPIAMAMHGRWGAGPQAFADADVCLLVGANPLVSMWGGIPAFNPAKRLHEARARGLKLIVIDPRRTETARKAELHLQCLPGHDSELLAAMLHVIFAEQLHDAAFVESETQGLEELRAAVAPFTPERVATVAGVEAADIATAARMFATARRGNATSGTGPSMAPHGLLMDYLVLALNTVCGRWIRAGELLPNRGVLFRQFSGVARTEKPRLASGFGETLRVRGLTDTAAGMPTAALADEILTPGPGQVKALFVVGGNPMLSWPNQAKTQRALAALELLVVVDPQVSATARLAHYVIGPRFGFETPAITFGNEGITTYGLSIGYQEPYAQYQPQIIEPPPGSEVLEDWRFFYELGRAMGMQLAYRGHLFDMQNPPTTDALLEQFVARSRVPLAEIKRYPHGHVFPDPQPFAAPKDEGWPHRLQLGHAAMLSELSAIARELAAQARCAAPDAGLGAKTPAPASTPVAPTTAVAPRLTARESPRARGLQLGGPAAAGIAPAPSVQPGLSASRRCGARGPRRWRHDADRIEPLAQCGPCCNSRPTFDRAWCRSPTGSSNVMATDGVQAPRRSSTTRIDFDPISGLPRMSAIPVKVSKAAQAAVVADV